MEKQRLDHGPGWAIIYSPEAVTSYPFIAERWHDGERGRHNHPCLDLVAEPHLIDRLPEVIEYPFLLQVLRALNAAGGSLRSTQCTPGMVDNTQTGRSPPFFAGATVHVAYRESSRNEQPRSLVELARRIVSALPQGSDGIHPVMFLLTVEPLKSWYGAPGYHCLNLEFRGAGKTAAHALASADIAAEKLAVAISGL